MPKPARISHALIWCSCEIRSGPGTGSPGGPETFLSPTPFVLIQYLKAPHILIIPEEVVVQYKFITQIINLSSWLMLPRYCTA